MMYVCRNCCQKGHFDISQGFHSFSLSMTCRSKRWKWKNLHPKGTCSPEFVEIMLNENKPYYRSLRMACAGERQRPPRPPPPDLSNQPINSVNTYSKLKQVHDTAYKFIDEGLSLDEQGKNEQAVECYTQGLSHIEKAMDLNSLSSDTPEDHKEGARKLLIKMSKSKMQIECRLENLRPSAPRLSDNAGSGDMWVEEEQPPSYEQATSVDHSFMELGDNLHNEDIAAGANNHLTTNATELYSISDGAQIFYINPDGYVSAPSYPSALKVYSFNDETEAASNSVERPPNFIQVGNWFYPLVPGVSPALHASYGAYIFPDTDNPHSGSSVGLILPSQVSHDERRKFEDMMGDLTALRQQQVHSTSEENLAEAAKEAIGIETEEEASNPSDRMASRISRGIIVAADWMSWGVNKGAEKAGDLIRRGSTQLQQHLKPEEKPREIPERYQTGIEKVRKATHTAVSVSGYVVGKLGQATVALGRQIAPQIRRQGERFLPRSLSKKEKDGHSKMDDFMEVATSSLHGFGTVYMGLETAAKALGKSLATETVQVVNHKYGSDAARFADHTLYSTGNLAMTGYNVNHLGVKAIAKRAAKDTGRAVLLDFKNSYDEEEKKRKTHDAGSKLPEKPPKEPPSE